MAEPWKPTAWLAFGPLMLLAAAITMGGCDGASKSDARLATLEARATSFDASATAGAAASRTAETMVVAYAGAIQTLEAQPTSTPIPPPPTPSPLPATAPPAAPRTSLSAAAYRSLLSGEIDKLLPAYDALQTQLTVALVNLAILDDASWRSQLQNHLNVLHAAYDRVVEVVPPTGYEQVQAKFSACLAALDGSATQVEAFLNTRDPSQLRAALGSLEASNALLNEATAALIAVS